MRGGGGERGSGCVVGGWGCVGPRVGGVGMGGGVVDTRGEVGGCGLGDAVVEEFGAEEGREGAVGFFGFLVLQLPALHLLLCLRWR